MDDLVQFLLARLKEDEQAALDATNESGRWQWDHGLGRLCDDPDCPYGALLDMARTPGLHVGTVLMEVHGYDVKEPWQGAEHIARHDPARVLREVEAKRRRLVTYEAACRRRDAEAEDYQVWSQGKAPSERPTFDGPDPALIPGLEYAVREDAQVYSDHPNFNSEWAVGLQ